MMAVFQKRCKNPELSLIFCTLNECFCRMHCAHAATRGSIVLLLVHHSQALNGHLQSNLFLGQLKKLLQVFLTDILVVDLFLSKTFREHSDVSSEGFFILKLWLWCCGFVGQQKAHIFIPSEIPPLATVRVLAFYLVVWAASDRGHQSLSQSLHLPGSRKW